MRVEEAQECLTVNRWRATWSVPRNPGALHPRRVAAHPRVPRARVPVAAVTAAVPAACPRHPARPPRGCGHRRCRQNRRPHRSARWRCDGATRRSCRRRSPVRPDVAPSHTCRVGPGRFTAVAFPGSRHVRRPCWEAAWKQRRRSRAGGEAGQAPSSRWSSLAPARPAPLAARLRRNVCALPLPRQALPQQPLRATRFSPAARSLFAPKERQGGKMQHLRSVLRHARLLQRTATEF